MPDVLNRSKGYSTITPALIINGAQEAIDLYINAFGAKEEDRMELEGWVMHTCLNIGSSKLFISEQNPEMEGGRPTQGNFFLYVENADAAFEKAKNAGLKPVYPVEEMFWGDRTGTVKDKFGNFWTLATHVRDVSPQEMKQGAIELVAKMMPEGR